jgi:hypothetical protein
MSDLRSRSGMLVGLAAAAGAFGAAAMMSAATAPTARADDFTDIVNSADFLLAAGQTAFTTADTDFASSDVIDGLQSFFNGVNDDSLGVPDIATLGTLEELAGDPISPGITFDYNLYTPPTDFADALTQAQSYFSIGESYFTDAASNLASGDYVDAFYQSALGSAFTLDIPAQDLLIGSVEALGL